MTIEFDDEGMNRENFKQLLQLKMRPEDVERIMEDAYTDAKEGHGHKDQRRDDGKRYFEHPRKVALILMLEAEVYDPDMIIAALLHDIVEDTFSFGTKEDDAYRRLERRYNKRVARFVLALSKDSCKNSNEKAERDDRYFNGITDEGPKTVLIKLADRLDNLRDFSCWKNARKMRYVQETRDRIIPMGEAVISQFDGGMRGNLLRILSEIGGICAITEREILKQASS